MSVSGSKSNEQMAQIMIDVYTKLLFLVQFALLLVLSCKIAEINLCNKKLKRIMKYYTLQLSNVTYHKIISQLYLSFISQWPLYPRPI